VYRLGLHLFRVTVWEHPAVKKRVTELILESIALERTGHADGNSPNGGENRARVKDIVSMLLELASDDAEDGAGDNGDDDNSNSNNNNNPALNHVYSEFEDLFLGTTKEFYSSESMDYIAKNTASDYVNKAQTRLAEEKERAAALGLPHTTEAQLTMIVQTELIHIHAQTLVDMEHSGFAALLRDETKVQEMKNMYDLFVRVPASVDHLREALSNRIKADGHALIADQERNSEPAAFCRGVLAMRKKYSAIVQTAFWNEKKAQKRMRESFEDFLNVDARAASCLAVYVDELLRVGLRGMTDAQVQDELQKAIVIFRYLSDKDVFESFYKQHLAKRLLSGRSVSDDAERSMVSLLKAECGYQFTTKIVSTGVWLPPALILSSWPGQHSRSPFSMHLP